MLRILKVDWTLGEPKSLGLNWNNRRDSYIRNGMHCTFNHTGSRCSYICKVKTFGTYFVARHVNYKKKKKHVNLGERNLITEIIWTSTRRPVFRVSDHARLKPTYSVTEISSVNAEILRVGSLSLILSWEPTIKALIRLRGCVGWSAPLMFACSYVRFSLDTVHKNDNVHCMTIRPSHYEINQVSL